MDCVPAQYHKSFHHLFYPLMFYMKLTEIVINYKNHFNLLNCHLKRKVNRVFLNGT
jgi:hypothetical protein